MLKTKPIVTIKRTVDIPLDEVIDMDLIKSDIEDAIFDRLEDWITDNNEVYLTLRKACCQYVGYKLIEEG